MFQSTAAVFSIFSELGMIQRWRIDKHSLGRFLLMVRMIIILMMMRMIIIMKMEIMMLMMVIQR